MAHKTFISYKYSEARGLRDRIIKALGDDASFYEGETSASPDLSDLKTETIRGKLKDMIFGTSVTIVIVSPCMTESEWIDWEIEYSLCEYSRNGEVSRPNGLVGVIMERYGGYGWIKSTEAHPDGHTTRVLDDDKLYPIIRVNRFNQHPKEYCCERCRSIDRLEGSYMSLIEEDEFLADPSRFIENAYDKSRRLWNYELCKSRELAKRI